jgi:tRNA (adenine22-N1)-methyltransferase
MVKLSNRLKQIADLVPKGSRLADIGSDHALLPTYLAQQGMISFAVAGEINEGPLKAAAKQVKEAELSHLIQVRLGDGLSVLRPGEVDVITIAGMGGALIVKILSEGVAKLEGVRTLVLQPNVGEDQVRRWLVEHDWFLAKEHILEEDGKIYEILTAVKTWNSAEANALLYADKRLDPELVVGKHRLLQMGPYLMEQASPVWFLKWEGEIEKLEKICDQLRRSTSETSKQKEAELRQEILEIKEVLHCLRKVKR